MLPVCVLISLKRLPKIIVYCCRFWFYQVPTGLRLSVSLYGAHCENNFLLSFEMIMDEVSLRAKEMSLLCLASFYKANYKLP